jgi:hypothetical protein
VQMATEFQDAYSVGNVHWALSGMPWVWFLSDSCTNNIT